MTRKRYEQAGQRVGWANRMGPACWRAMQVPAIRSSQIDLTRHEGMASPTTRWTSLLDMRA